MQKIIIRVRRQNSQTNQWSCWQNSRRWGRNQHSRCLKSNLRDSQHTSRVVKNYICRDRFNTRTLQTSRQKRKCSLLCHCKSLQYRPYVSIFFRIFHYDIQNETWKGPESNITLITSGSLSDGHNVFLLHKYL